MIMSDIRTRRIQSEISAFKSHPLEGIKIVAISDMSRYACRVASKVENRNERGAWNNLCG